VGAHSAPEQLKIKGKQKNPRSTVSRDFTRFNVLYPVILIDCVSIKPVLSQLYVITMYVSWRTLVTVYVSYSDYSLR